MASIHKDRRSKFWQLSWRDASGRKFNRSAKIEHTPGHEDAKQRKLLADKNRRLAQEMANEIEGAARGNPIENQLRRIVADIAAKAGGELEFAKAGAFLEKWLAGLEHTASPATRARYKTAVKNFLAGLGPKAEAHLGDVTARDVDAFVHARRAAGRTASTVKTDLAILNAPFNQAMRQGLILANPVAAASPVKAEQESRRAFAPEEIRRLAAAAEGEWKTLVLLGAYTGLRLGDCARLKWANVDLARKIIRLRPAKTQRQKKDLVVPIHRRLHSHLLEIPASDDPETPISPKLARTRPGGKGGLSEQFAGVMKAAGIERETVAAASEGGRAFNRLTFHSLRHSFVSMLEESGIHPDLRKKLSGHADDRIHAAYTHTQVETLAKAVNSLADL